MEKRRLQRIQVNALFDRINYDIDLHCDNPIAILTAPNGMGKTTILNLVAFLFDPNYSRFVAIRNVPFKSIKCYLSNQKAVELRTIPIRNSDRDQSTKRSNARDKVMNFGLGNFDYEFYVYDEHEKAIYSVRFGDVILKRMNNERGSIEEYVEYVYRAGREDRIFIPPMQALLSDIAGKLEELEAHLVINYVKADRIQPSTVSFPRRRIMDEDEPETNNPLVLACDKIQKQINNATDEYNDVVSKAKDNLPLAFVSDEGNQMELDQFLDEWKEYRSELTQFQQIGLIPLTDDFTKGKDLTLIYKNKGSFLSTYLQAFRDTTQPLRDIYTRLRLFKTILDERNVITGKVISFSKKGVELIEGEHVIDLDTLSSGEKHDFIMFYNLIFNSEKGGLVMIDEPEISLHIEWQETYLDRLMEICEMNNLQAFVATHSPNIVSSHYDFLVEKN